MFTINDNGISFVSGKKTAKVCLCLLLLNGNAFALDFGIISAVKKKVSELKEKKDQATQGTASYALAPQTQSLSSETNSQLLSVSQDSSTFRFSLQAQQIGSLKSGEIMMSTQGEGYLKKVVSVTNTGTDYVVQTETATLEQAFESLNVEFSQGLSQSDLAPQSAKPMWLAEGVRYKPSAVEKEFTVEIASAVLYDADGNSSTTYDRVIAVGTLKFKVTLDGKIVIDFFDLKEFKISKAIEETASLEIKSEANYQFTKEKTLAKFYFSPITVGPIILVPEVAVVVGGIASVGYKVTTSIAQTAIYTAGLWYAKGAWKPIQNYTSSFQYNQPSFGAQGNIKGYAGPQLSMKIYGILGPYINADGYLNLVAQSSPPNLNWTLYGGLEGNGGVKMNVLSLAKLDYSSTIFDWQVVIASGSKNANHAPTLTWTGESNYTLDGLNPEEGDTSTNFVFHVKYTDQDGDTPASGYPKVNIKKGAVAISGSPFTMTKVSGDYSSGAVYTYSAALSGGTDYSYSFVAQDSYGTTATNSSCQ